MPIYGAWNLTGHGIDNLSGYGLMRYGEAPPTDGLASYAKSCLFLSSGDGKLYRNHGDETSCLFRAVEDIVGPSGDTGGAADADAILAAIDRDGFCALTNGTYTIDETISLSASSQHLFGIGRKSVIQTADDTFPAITIDNSADGVQIGNLRIVGGQYGIEINEAQRVELRNVNITTADSHGIYVHGDSNAIRIFGGLIASCGDDGINAVATATVEQGNALSVFGTIVEANGRHGIRWGASTLAVHAAVIQGNTDSGLHIDATAHNVVGASILGNHFEGNGTAEIEFETTSKVIDGVKIDGNYVNADATVPFLKSTDTGAATGRVRNVWVGQANSLNGSESTTKYTIGSTIRLSKFEDLSDGDHDIPDSYISENDIRSVQTREVQTKRLTVDCSGGGTAQTDTLLHLPAGSILHEVIAKTVTQFDGDATTTFEVGVSGNADKYIDSVEFNPAGADDWQAMTGGGSNDQGTAELMVSDTDIIATWTNTASASAGEIDVYITYTMAIEYAQDV